MATRKQNISPIYLEPGDTVTCTAAAAVTGSRFVKATAGGLGNRPSVTPAGAGDTAYGVAHYDAASGDSVPVKRVGTHGVTAGAALSAGDLVSVGADGKAVKATAIDIAGSVAPTPVAGICVADTALNAIAPITLA